MFTQTAQFYDKIYAIKDYPAEVENLRVVHIPTKSRCPPVL